jgi:RNA polymerase sigma factor (sigma-70 family)
MPVHRRARCASNMHREFIAMSSTLARSRRAEVKRAECRIWGGVPAMSDTNRTALLALLVASYDDLRLRLMRRSGSADLADEALQDTFLRLSNATVVGQVRDLHAYLFRVAMSVVSNRRVAERRHLSVSETDMLLNLVDDSPDPERVIEARSEIDALKRVIQELPERRREILMAALVEEVPLRKIAWRFGVSVRTIQVELKQALVHCAVRLGRGPRATSVTRRRSASLDQRDRARRVLPSDNGLLPGESGWIAADDGG